MLVFGTPQPSRYIRITWMISSEAALRFPDSSNVRFFGVNEAESLAREVRRQNASARLWSESNFYLRRINELSDHSVIEVFRPGSLQSTGDEGARVSDLIEKLVILSSTLVLSKAELQKKLGISPRPQTEIDFVLGPAFRGLSSRSRTVPNVQGVKVDEQFCRRFSKCGFFDLYKYSLSEGKLQQKVRTSMDWLYESRRESSIHASVVKTAIALESLLIFTESESLAGSLSERMAFILSSLPETRKQISATIKRFYNARSRVVHGSRRQLADLSPLLVEAVDRFMILLYLTVAANGELWSSPDELRNWCEMQRWGTPSTNLKIPYSPSYLKHAMALAQK